MQASAGSFIKKETLVQVFSSQFYEILQNTYSIEHLRATTSRELLNRKNSACFTLQWDPITLHKKIEIF